MLPTNGYFRGISCPEHERNYCHRPHCHFRHNPKKDMTDDALQSSISVPDVEKDGTTSSHETLRVSSTNSNTETEIVKDFGSLEQQIEDSDEEEESISNEEKQAELLQHLVSEAVKKVLAENPLLTTSGIDQSLVVKSIDTSALAARAAAEVTQANAKSKKKYYFRPPDLPSYNPTPIKELNKRKRSIDYNEDVSASKSKALKYTPTPLVSVKTLQNTSESEQNSKEYGESEVTDFSSDEADEDVDKRRCDFDILEEVLAEHSQNNKARVKKKKVKALGKPHYSLNVPDRKVDESSMISDARNVSDQDSNSCDMPVMNTENKVPNEGSYFLPPSPVFTSSSDGFGAFSSIVYTKPNASPEECESDENKMTEKSTVQNLKEKSEKEESTHATKEPTLLAKAEKKRICKDDIKKRAKGHTHLPQVLHSLGAPKLSRPNVRNWTPQVRSATSDSRREGDPLEEMLQLMDGNDASKKEKALEGSKNSPAVSGHHASPKNKKKYEVDLDKEIESLTNSSSSNKGELTLEDAAALHSKESNKLVEASHKNEKEPETKESRKVGEKSNARKGLENDTNENEKDPEMDVDEEVKASKSDALDTDSEDESSDSNSADKTTDDSDSEHERKRHKKKRKRSPSSSFESDHSHHRKKRKKYHKRHRKQRSKKRRKKRDRKSHSSYNDEKLMKDSKDDDEDKSDIAENILKDENDKTKKGKKHKKKSKHRKSKYKRKKGKSKSKKKTSKSHSRSRSSSVNRSHSSSSNRSRSSSERRSRSSSSHRSSSSSRHSSRCLGKNRSKSPSKGRIETPNQRSRNLSKSKDSYTHKSQHRGESEDKSSSESTSKDRSRNSSKGRSRSSSKDRSRSSSKDRSRSSSKDRSRSSSMNRSRSLSKGRSTSSSMDRSTSSSKGRSRSSSKDRSRSSSRFRKRSSSKHRRSRSLSKNRSKSPSKDRGENINQSQSHSRSKSKYGHQSQHRKERVSRSQNEMPSKHRSRSSSRHRSRSSSKCRSETVSKNQTQSLSKSRREKTIRRSRSSSRSKVSHSNKSQHRKESNAKESHHTDSQVLSTPMPIDPSKIKVEKEEMIPDLSLVKTEKLDTEEPSNISLSMDKVNNYSEVNTKSSNVGDKKIDSGNQKSSKDAAKNLESFKREREHFRLNTDKVSKRRDSHERRSSTEVVSEKSISDRRCSTDSKKSDNGISQEKKKQEDRRISIDKIKKEKVSSPKSDSHSKPMSMFDLVLAGSQTPKSKSLTEISMFDAVTNMHDENVASSSVPSDDEVEERNYDLKTQKHSSQEMCSDQKHSNSHSIVRSKTELSSKIDKINDHPKSDSARHSHRSVDSRIDSNPKGNKSESKHTHSLSTKDKKHSHHIRSSSHQNSNSSHHKSIGNGGGSSSSSKHHSSSSSSSKSHLSGRIINSSMSAKTIHPSDSKIKEGISDISSSSHCRSKHSSSKHHHSSKSSRSGTQHKDRKDKIISTNKAIRSKKECKTEEITKIKKITNIEETAKNKKAVATEESSDGISDRDLYNWNDTGVESPLPDLSVLDEIPEHDWEQMMSSSDRNLQNYEDFDIDDLDRDDPQVMEECMKMFNDYQPDPEELETHPSSKKARRKSVDEEPEPLHGKQRISRSNATGNLIPKKPSAHQHRMTPAQIMMERFKKLKEQQSKLMKQVEKQKQQLNEQSRGGSSSAVSSSTSAKPNVSPASSSTSIMSPPHSSLAGGMKRRISHVPNVSSLLTAREKIKNLPPTNSRSLLSPNVSKASGAVPQTQAQTVSKREKRIAHTIRPEMLARPVIQAEFGSKVPQNIRQRYLNLFIDECLKFCGEMEAFNIAAAEECVCVKRASSRMVYLNLAVNAVKRLRTQQKAGEAAQELLEKEPQYAESLSVEEPSTSSVSSSSSKEVKPHPTNPNHVRLSHFTVLAGGGQKGSWSIEKPKKNSQDVQDRLKGEAFYKHLMKYILTEDQLMENGYPSPDPDEKGKAIIKKVNSRKKISPSSVERYCDRCSVLYMVDKWGFPKSTGPCVHHWGRAYKRRGIGGPEARYSCCGGDLQSEGCCQAVTHVSANFNPNNLHGYVRTLPKDTKGNDYGVYALDCEMCYTTSGNELTRVTVINSEGSTVYEHLVKPENPIIDYNTRFSGITESDLQDVKTTLLDVQAAFLTRFSDKTILIGHSLESDFHALKLIHDTVVDTSVVFPHKMGAPYKRALRTLASEYLKKIIQNDVSGHDSAEDAITCMHLMQWKVKEDIKGMR